jgi:hypothetical protein
MTANIEALADATMRLKPTFPKHISLPSVARTAVRRSGITNEDDVKRISRRSAIKRAAQSRRTRYA